MPAAFKRVSGYLQPTSWDGYLIALAYLDAYAVFSRFPQLHRPATMATVSDDIQTTRFSDVFDFFADRARHSIPLELQRWGGRCPERHRSCQDGRCHEPI